MAVPTVVPWVSFGKPSRPSLTAMRGVPSRLMSVQSGSAVAASRSHASSVSSSTRGVSKSSKNRPSSAVPVRPSGPTTRVTSTSGMSRSSSASKSSLVRFPSASRETRVSVKLPRAGVAGSVYLVGALLMGVVLLGFGVRFGAGRSRRLAIQLMVATLVYMPVLLTLLVLDKRSF